MAIVLRVSCPSKLLGEVEWNDLAMFAMFALSIPNRLNKKRRSKKNKKLRLSQLNHILLDMEVANVPDYSYICHLL